MQRISACIHHRQYMTIDFLSKTNENKSSERIPARNCHISINRIWGNRLSMLSINNGRHSKDSCCTSPLLTHWVTHICVGEQTIIGSDNGLSPVRRQAIIWTNDGILLIGPLGTNFSEILIGIQIFSVKKMPLKMSSAKWRSFCLGLNVLNVLYLGNLSLSLSTPCERSFAQRTVVQHREYNGHLCSGCLEKNSIYTIGELYNRADEKWVLVQPDIFTTDIWKRIIEQLDSWKRTPVRFVTICTISVQMESLRKYYF